MILIRHPMRSPWPACYWRIPQHSTREVRNKYGDTRGARHMENTEIMAEKPIRSDFRLNTLEVGNTSDGSPSHGSYSSSALSPLHCYTALKLTSLQWCWTCLPKNNGDMIDNFVLRHKGPVSCFFCPQRHCFQRNILKMASIIFDVIIPRHPACTISRSERFK